MHGLWLGRADVMQGRDICASMLRATQASVEEAKRRAGDPFFPESDEKETVTGLHGSCSMAP